MSTIEKPKQTPTLLAYLAGYFEGEGTITIKEQPNKAMKNRDKHSRVLFIQVGNTEPEICELYYLLWGGSYKKESRTSIRNSKPIYLWKIHARSALPFLKKILPYLKTNRKKELALLCIAFQEHKKWGGLNKDKRNDNEEYHKFDDDILGKVRALNHKGVL
jgi:hypothetical protein